MCSSTPAAASRCWLASAAVFAAVLAVYGATAARFMRWGDGPEFVAVAQTLGIAHPPGYPLYTLISALAIRVPVGAPFFRMSMLSGIFGAAAAALIAAIVWRVPELGHRDGSGRSASSSRTSLRATIRSALVSGPGGWLSRTGSALLAGCVFAFAPTVWSQAVVPEVYTLSALLLFVIVMLLVDWELTAEGSEQSRHLGPARLGGRLVLPIGLAVGLSLAHHLTAVLVLPAAALVLFAGRVRPSFRLSLGGLALALVGISLYAYLPVRAAQDPALLWTPIETWSDLLGHISGAQYAPLLFSSPPPEIRHKLLLLLVQLPLEIPWPVLVLSALGLVSIWMRSRLIAYGLALWVVLVVVHAAVYRIPDISVYYIPVYGVLAVAAGQGFFTLFSLTRGRRSRAPSLGAAAVGIALAACWLLADAQWDDHNLRHSDQGRIYLSRLLNSVRHDGIVITVTDRVLFPLWYARFVEGQRPDIAAVCVRERAPHLAKWFPAMRLPSEAELSSLLSGATAATASLDSTPVGSYLTLLPSLNEPARPLHADADLARRVFPDRSVPRGLLVRVVASDDAGADTLSSQLSYWDRIAVDLAGADDPLASEMYAKTLAEQGMLFIERGETGAAIELLQRAVSIAPGLPLCHSNLGVAYAAAGRFDEGRTELDAAIALDPTLAVPHFNMYRLARETGDASLAREELDAAVSLSPRDVTYRVELATRLEDEGDLKGAERTFELAARIAPDDLGVKLAYGDFLARRHRFSEAVGLYEDAAELKPDVEGALKGLGRCYWALDDREEALSVMTRLVELQPNNPAAKYDLAVMMNRTGQKRRAILLLDDVIRILPAMWEAVAYKAGILADMGRLWEARALYERAADLGARGASFERARQSVEDALRGARRSQSESDAEATGDTLFPKQQSNVSRPDAPPSSE